nr:MAG TPA: HNH endonuclease [Caudoviricetes sp.]
MPKRPLKPCRFPACRELIAGGQHFCAAHTKAKQMESDQRRGTAHERGYTSAWTKARGYYLRAHPLCVRCQEVGLIVEATVVDHIIPHKLKDAIDSNDAKLIEVARALFWDSKNWQSLCKTDHDIKTAREDGGFGRCRGGGGSKP